MVLKNYPIIQQLRDDDCGVAALQSVLLYYGIHERYPVIAHLLEAGTHGVTPEAMKGGLKHHGIEHMPSHPSLEDIRRHVSDGYPVLVLVQHDRDMYTKWEDEYKYGHWVSVIGFTKRSLILADPGTGKEERILDKAFCARWHDEGFDQYAIITRGVS